VEDPQPHSEGSPHRGPPTPLRQGQRPRTSHLAVAITGLDVIDNKAFAEWVMEADHVGPLVIDDIRVEPTGQRLQLGGATIAEFEGHRIRAFRTYFDTLALLEQMIDAG
jgi:hypothetical protein